MTDSPVGIFDSGVGGLTVARAILDQLPHEQLIYLGDTAHVPYGPKRIADVRRYSLAGLDALVDLGVKILVIACNAASSACLHDARERYSIPVVEVIRPAVRRAAAATRNGRVGVIGTQVTVASRAYEDAFVAAPQVSVSSVACPQFVDFVERGITTGRALLGLASAYLEPLQRAGVDTLVLGCTHYPLLAGLISLVMGDEVSLVSSADETAKDVYRVLTQLHLARADDAPAPVHQFLTTGDAESFARLGRRFLGADVFAAAPVMSLPVRADAGDGTPGDLTAHTPDDAVAHAPGDPVDHAPGDPVDHAPADPADHTPADPVDRAAGDRVDCAAGDRAGGAPGDPADHTAGGRVNVAAGDRADRAAGDRTGVTDGDPADLARTTAPGAGG